VRTVKARNKRIWLALGLLLPIAAASLVLLRKPPRRPIITLPSGEQFQFVAAVWGTNDVPPTFAEQTMAHLPVPVAGFIRRMLGRHLTLAGQSGFSVRLRQLVGRPPEPALHIWFRSNGTITNVSARLVKQSSGLGATLADTNGVAGEMAYAAPYGSGSTRWLTWGFKLVPRRSATLTLRYYQMNSYLPNNPQEIGRVSLSNPLFKSFPQWQPDPPGAVKMAGDLEVRIAEFSREQHVLAISSPRGTNEAWEVHNEELSDITGNVQRKPPGYYRPRGKSLMWLGPRLWQGEQAWRYKVELKRCRSYMPEDLVTFNNVAVPPAGSTNTLFLTNHLAGAMVVLKQQLWFDPNAHLTRRTLVSLEMPRECRELALDLVDLKATTGWSMNDDFEQRQNGCSCLVWGEQIPSDVASVDMTWAVQKTRKVEFFVKPPQATK
jgi:hypothetical protein